MRHDVDQNTRADDASDSKDNEAGARKARRFEIAFIAAFCGLFVWGVVEAGALCSGRLDIFLNDWLR